MTATKSALGVAARLWCEPSTEKLVMVPELAELFAEKIDGYHALIEAAWGLIANANHGDWTGEAEDWQEAAAHWREGFHAMLDADLMQDGRPS